MADGMTLDEFQDGAFSTAVYPNPLTVSGLVYTALGLGEVGEFQNQVKKVLRDDDGILTYDRRLQLIKELGDILWYVAVAAVELDIHLSDVGQMTLAKLQSRKERGTLHGSGEDR